jgi:hypothetical protein
VELVVEVPADLVVDVATQVDHEIVALDVGVRVPRVHMLFMRDGALRRTLDLLRTC